MDHASSSRQCSRRQCARGSGQRALVLASIAAVACGEVLGIPSKPELVPPAPPSRASSVSVLDENPDAAPPPDGANGGGGTRTDGGSSRDGIDGESTERGPLPGLDPSVTDRDAGATSSRDAALPEPGEECPNPPLEVPIDVIFIVDNSGSMAAVHREFEVALPDFARALDDGGVDYRIILISHHRNAARNASEEASTSVCVSAPLGGPAACPSSAPALGSRFFQYSTRIGGTNSFAQVLAAFTTPDPFGLTSAGWSEWLRSGARKVFVEISDANSVTPSIEFVDGLAAAAPEHFAPDPSNPGFVFHSIVGISQRTLTLDVYGPDESIRSAVCSGGGSEPANAGEAYQELSRSTGGLRQSICPADAMSLRLSVLRLDVANRSVEPCP
jgi:hypothetical protein